MIYVGLDPSIAAFGIGVIERSGASIRYRHAFRIRTKSSDPMPDRLDKIFDNVGSIIREFHPELVGCEEQRNVQVGKWQRQEAFKADNTKTLLAVGSAHGACRAYGARIAFFQPQTLKVAVMGPGSRSASKEAIRERISRLIGAPATLSLDESDAIAAAIAASNTTRALAVGSGRR